MRVLIIKTSSMGDVIHTLPALTDASQAIPDITFDWVVEPGFAEIPHWHSNVERVIPFAFRRWRREKMKTIKSGEWREFYHALTKYHYDAVIDAQCLLKSAWLTRLAHGRSHGLSWGSAREPLASLFYQRRHQIERTTHAVQRVRELFANALDYTVPNTIDYGIARQQLKPYQAAQPYCVFLHATTWTTKHWPVAYWRDLIKQVEATGVRVLLPWGSQKEQENARVLAQGFTHVDVLPKLSLTEVAGVLAGAKAVVAVDTGLGHLSAALAVPTISLYGPTDPKRTGTFGQNQQHLAAQFACAPCLQERCTYRGARDVEPVCFSTVTPSHVWQRLNLCLTVSEPA